MFVVLSLCICACSKPPVQNPARLGSPGTIAPEIPPDYRLAVGDHVQLRLFYNPDLNQDVIVRPDGKISLQLVHDVDALGLTPMELMDKVTEGYSKFLQQPEVTVIVTAFAGQRFYVGGEVATVGAKELVGPTTVLQAITLAGGFKDTSDRNQVVIIRKNAETGKPIIMVVDIEKVMKGIDFSQDIYLKPFDMVLVPRTRIADIGLWVNQYIRSTISVPREFLYYYQFQQSLGSGSGAIY